MKTVIAIHNVGTGTCSFSGKKGEGATVSFANGMFREQFLSWVSLKKLAVLTGNQLSDRQPDNRPQDASAGNASTMSNPK